MKPRRLSTSVIGLLLGTAIAVSASAKAGTAEKTAQDRARQAKQTSAPRATGAVQLQLTLFDGAAMRRAIEDLSRTFPNQYRRAPQYLKRLRDFEARLPEIRHGLADGEPQAARAAEQLLAFQREVLLSNPLLDFDSLLLVRRGLGRAETTDPASAPPASAAGEQPPIARLGKPDKKKAATGQAAPAKTNLKKLGLPQNWQGNCALAKTGYDNDLDVLSPLRPDAKLQPLFRPEGTAFVGDMRLHFDADRLLFSMPSAAGPWQIFEINTDGHGLRQVTRNEPPGADNYDACYLPDGRIIFTSTANLQGVPCVGGSIAAANLALLDPASGQTRMLAFEQDHDWCPTLLPNGRVMYTRWEYTDTAHYFTRIVFSMNPDGTGQMEHYGSNSYWPNSLFYCRPIPGQPTQFVGIVTGHHGVPRMGELVLFDTALGRREADGVVQRIPGWGQPVEPVIQDGLVNNSWPKFLHPCPLSAKYFLVACQPRADALWGIYLADVFDNLVLIKELPGNALFEPVPLRPTPKPPVIPDKVDLSRSDATVYLVDVYRGPGLQGLPRGTVKQLRVFSYSYCYQGVGGHDRVGVESSWDVKRILGTVPVEADGSALFRVPANTPISVQPLDEQGQALQLMRSWFTAMPGEVLSCVGCHESQNASPPSRTSLAATRAPSRLQPWYGPPRGFGFLQEVQPVLDQHCVACHDGQDRPGQPALADFADVRPVSVSAGKKTLKFPGSYLALHPHVVRPGPESDYHVLSPMDFHASVSPLVQLLRKGHHGVALDAEGWDRLSTWIDMNVPCYGSWREAYGGEPSAEAKIDRQCEARTKHALQLAGLKLDPRMEQLPAVAATPAERGWQSRTATDQGSDGSRTASTHPDGKKPARIKVSGWPFDANTAQRRQTRAGAATEQSLDLGDETSLPLVLIPAGDFVMGDAVGAPDEQPQTRAKLAQPFWVGACEITNRQFAQFDPSHDSGFIDQQGKDHNSPGYPANQPQQPVIRVSWEQALAYCAWLSTRTGRRFTLPTEAQWEWACRAGSDRAMWYGDVHQDFGTRANLADAMLANLAVRGVNPQPIKESTYLAFLPRVAEVNDGQVIAGPVGRYEPNPWGLRDMHGSVAEWTRSTYRPYPYDAADGRDDPATPGEKVVRGGSWRDVPARARAAFRQAYPPYQRVFNVGFRVVCETD